ncbi:hypothetical protein Acr_06g0013060 [Actinidia rufa]|uniref:ZF-HD dimerization-type domain-containing protein n=1 Tax=Actinidia rufa TaxID=165716 RepID=A0A7J0ET24_9ERIC|nr:hypothetical protein Acr_06g0013060 [Actinidia rufa]
MASNESVTQPIEKTDRHVINVLLYPSNKVRYAECRRNYAASIGGFVLDGCGEFMPRQGSQFCDACGCHRNFHREVLIEGNVAGVANPYSFPPPPPPPPPPSPSHSSKPKGVLKVYPSTMGAKHY